MSLDVSCHSGDSVGLINVVVPNDFRKKYKIISELSKKCIGSFAFRGSSAYLGADVDEAATDNGEVECGDAAVSYDEVLKIVGQVVVYKAIDRQKKYVIVEKTGAGLDSVGMAAIQIEYFDRIDLLRRIDHECIPRVLDVFDTPQEYTIVLQYAVGKSLTDLISKRGRPDNMECIRNIILALISTLKNLHKMNVAHRNISSDHLIVGRFNHFSSNKDLKVVGLSRITHIPPPPEGTLGGESSYRTTAAPLPGVSSEYTTVFSAPELSSPNHTLAVDLYSLGVVIYALVSGTIPQHKSDIHISSLRASRNLKKVVKSLLHPNPEERFRLRKVEKFFSKSFLSLEQQNEQGAGSAVVEGAGKEEEEENELIVRSRSASSDFESCSSVGTSCNDCEWREQSLKMLQETDN